VLEAYREALTRPGDRARGKAVFAKNCAACHRLHGTGHDVGPDLAALAGKSAEYLLTEILDPNRNVDTRYVEYVATTHDGRTFTGILASETASGIVLRGQDGREQALLRAELEGLHSTGKSLMPEGLEKTITRQQMADLLAYLTGRPPLSDEDRKSAKPGPPTATHHWGAAPRDKTRAHRPEAPWKAPHTSPYLRSVAANSRSPSSVSM
jgi:putative heme-binding domain-containing protein